MNTSAEEKGDNPSSNASTADVESSESLSFDPPVYLQRYHAIIRILNEETWQNEVTSVVDFGCAEFKLFKFLKSLNHIHHVFGVDVDESVMNRCHYEAKPMLYEFLDRYSRNLTVDLFVGSIAEPDSRLVDVDAVICIELIEHLYPDTLERVPFTVFECIQPKIAIFTTPNSDFNVLFNLKGFRHYDHKFEWSRQEFEEWCQSIIREYDNYEVHIEGIGQGPEGTEHLGCVSQMAVFTRVGSSNGGSKCRKVTETPYKLFERIEYPFIKDERTEEEKLLVEVKYWLNNVLMKKSLYDLYQTDDGCEVPLNFLWNHLTQFCSDEQDLREKLTRLNYKVESNSIGIDVIKVTEEYSDSSSDYSVDADSDLITYSNTPNEELWE